MPDPDIDWMALTALRLLPDEPQRALQVWADAFERASAAGLERELLRLRIVALNHEARFGDRDGLGPRMLAAAAQARERGWVVEGLLVDLLELFLGPLGTNHEDGMRDVEAIRTQAEAHLEPVELSWMDLMSGHFRGYLV